MSGPELFIIGTVMSAGMQVYMGFQAAAAGDIANQQAREAAEMQKLQALADKNDRMEELRYLLGVQQAISASSNVDVSESVSLLAKQKAEKEKAERDARNIQLFGDFAARNLLYEGELARSEGRSRRVSGLVGGFGTGFSNLGFAKLQGMI